MGDYIETITITQKSVLFNKEKVKQIRYLCSLIFVKTLRIKEEAYLKGLFYTYPLNHGIGLKRSPWVLFTTSI